jgi:hypothetical protein
MKYLQKAHMFQEYLWYSNAIFWHISTSSKALPEFLLLSTSPDLSKFVLQIYVESAEIACVKGRNF